MTTQPAAAAAQDPRADAPPYWAAGAVTLVVLAIYALTIAPTTQFWDTSEYIAAAKILGIPHPPGNPLFVLVANVWGRIPFAEHYALRINFLAAVTSALASGFLFLVAERFLRDLLPGPRWVRWATAFGGVLVGATAFTVWNQSVVNEKVYTLSLLSTALVLWLAVHWGDQPAGARRDHWLLVIVYVVALSATNHLMGLLVVPAVAVYVLFTDARVVLRWRMWVAAAVVAAVGMSVFVLLPIRAGYFPAINEGEPVCHSWGQVLVSIYTMPLRALGIDALHGCQALTDVLDREQYQKGPLLPRQADLLWQYANYLQYFSWQFAHDLGDRAQHVAAALFGALGLVGAGRHWQRDRRGAAAMLALMATVTIALVFYLDFKYGYSINAEAGAAWEREVRERDYFFIASFQLFGVWAALGFGTVVAGIATALAALPERRRWARASAVLVLALVPLAANYRSASRRGETFPRDTAWDILQSVEPYGILFTTGDNDMFPLWYMQEVEGVRRDVLIANQSLMNTIWHVRQLKRRAHFPFDSADAVAPYRGRPWPAPTASALAMSEAEINALPPYQVAPQGQVYRVGNLRVAQPTLTRSDLVTLLLIRDNLGKRPIYFSRTTGGYADQMGFTPFLLGQGLVRELRPDSIRASETVRYVPSLGWVDLPRTETLMFDVYRTASAETERPCGWIDRPSEGMLQLYWLLYGAYGSFVATGGYGAAPADTTSGGTAQRAKATADRILAQTSLSPWRAGGSGCSAPPAPRAGDG